MPADYSKIINHPDSEEIVGKLVSGIRAKDVSEWLKIKYQDKDEAHLKLSAALLKEFVDNNLNLYETLKQDIQGVKAGGIDKKISAALKNNKTYQERMLEMADDEVDIKKMFKSVYVMLNARVEQYFDKIQQNPESLKPDYGLLKFFDSMMMYVEKYDKIINKSPDQIIQHNVTVQVMDQYVSVMQDSIRQTLAEMDSDAANLFLERFNENISKLQLPEGMQPVKPQTQEQKYLGVEILHSKLEELEGKI